MNSHKLTGAAILMLCATIGWGQATPEEHAAHHPVEGPSAAAAAPAREMMSPGSTQAKSRELIEKAEVAKSASERERLLAEHLREMRAELETLKSQQCEMMPKMGGASMGAETPPGPKPEMMGGMKSDPMMKCHAMMKAHMDSLTDLLAQTWRREEIRAKHAK